MSATRQMPQCLLFVTLVLTLFALGPATNAVTYAGRGPRQPSSKIAPSLGFLLSLLSEEIPVDPGTSLGEELARIRASGKVEVSARFEHELSPDDQADIESLGVEFMTVSGEVAHVDRFYAVLVPTLTVDLLADHALTEWLEAVWQPAVQAPLDLSITYNAGAYTYVDAPGVWNTVGFTPLTGQGIRIANFDTGVDVLHPAFLNGTYGSGYTSWDSNGTPGFQPGSDQLLGATLRFWDASGDPNNNPGVFDVTQDWVYGDTNGNSLYDWTETVYMAYDVNGNGTLDGGEYLIDRGTLGPGIPTSKILATLDGTAVQRTRGLDLELTSPDTSGHGTGVTGILGAGAAYWGSTYVWPNARRYTGMAPDADLLVADRVGLNMNFGLYMPWAQWLGAQIMLYEYGGWVQTYLDGSSNHEQAMDVLSQAGILQVVPTGNLHCGYVSACIPRHMQYQVPNGQSVYQFGVPLTSPAITQIYASLLWLNPANNLSVRVSTPGGSSVLLPCGAPPSGWQYVRTPDNSHWVGCERAANSSRGTALYNIYITGAIAPQVATGPWTVTALNPSSSYEPANFYIADDATGWHWGAGWTTIAPGCQEAHTATWPSTCDSCLGVASYSTRGTAPGSVGALSWFSGRGPRFFDNARIVDVAAPGHYDIITPQSRTVSGSTGSYNASFGGTSAAGPHAAGLAALLYHFALANVNATHVAGAIMHGAVSDAFTGAVPNNFWGYGKLSGPGARDNLMHDLGDAPASQNSFGTAMTAYGIPYVQANFPTVFSAKIPGPLHWAAGSLPTGPVDACLGTSVTKEVEADTSFDEDIFNNIRPSLDIPDQDSMAAGTIDDGVTMPVPLAHCQATSLPYVVTVAAGRPTTPRYVNVWFDWQQDGDWADTPSCPDGTPAPEWAVQDETLTLSPGTYARLSTPFVPIVTIAENVPFAAWMRISLAESQAPTPGDSRGPAAGYAFGETEDYLLFLDPYMLIKSAAITEPTPGLQFTYHISYSALGNVLATDTVISDVLPLGVSYVSSNPPGTYDPANRTITWSVALTPNTPPAAVDLVVEVTGVPSDTVTNTAYLLWGDSIWKRSSFSFHITGTAGMPQALFTSTSPACVSSTVAFTNLSSGAPPLTFAWDLDGDGHPDSTATNPTRHYGTPGAYTVTLTATNAYGQDTYSDTIQVLQPLSQVEIEGPASLLTGQAGTYTAIPDPANATNPLYAWSNGGSGVTTTYSWGTPGSYTVAVTASNDCGAVSGGKDVLVTTTCISLTGVSIGGPISLQVGEEGTYVATPHPTSATQPSYLWSDGTTAATAVYSWTVAGAYSVTVTATNCGSLVFSDSMSVYVWDTIFRVYLPLVLRSNTPQVGGWPARR